MVPSFPFGCACSVGNTLRFPWTPVAVWLLQGKEVMAIHPLPLRTLHRVGPRATKSEIAEIGLRPHRLRIRYTENAYESISLAFSEYLLIHRVLAESGHTEQADGTWAQAAVN